MGLSNTRRVGNLLVAIFFGVIASPIRGDDGVIPRVHGELREVQSLRVLRVWGIARERGYAQGALVGEEIVRLLNAYLDEIAPGEEGAKAYESKARALIRTMVIAPHFKSEIEGMLAGIRTKMTDGGMLPRLGRAIEQDDLIALNCIPEIARVGCSSFAAWGPMTKSGGTISGRNLDWHSLAALEGGQILLAQIPDSNEDENPWVSVTWPGFIGCLTGMNAEGVTVCMHDVHADEPTMPLGFTPRGFALRQVIEGAHASTAVLDGRDVLKKCLCRVGNNVVLSAPCHPGNGRPSVVFEYDGRVLDSSGVTVRAAPVAGKGKKGKSFQIATNHYRKRAEPRTCVRYQKIDEKLSSIANSSGQLDIEGAWEILKSVAQQSPPGQHGLLTYQSVVFEPNELRMHVALSRGGKAATDCPVVTVEVAELLRPHEARAAGN